MEIKSIEYQQIIVTTAAQLSDHRDKFVVATSGVLKSYVFPAITSDLWWDKQTHKIDLLDW